LIACPVAPTTAFKIGEHTGDPVSMYLEDVFTLPANLAGVPGIAFPVGFDQEGLPIGIQLNAPHMGESTLFETAHLYQTQTDWHTRTPDVAEMEA
jgi:aspartyl-tRNA(Asn)/glutamyl-tRNA(Gln) amidotransferase subunit A